MPPLGFPSTFPIFQVGESIGSVGHHRPIWKEESWKIKMKKNKPSEASLALANIKRPVMWKQRLPWWWWWGLDALATRRDIHLRVLTNLSTRLPLPRSICGQRFRLQRRSLVLIAEVGPASLTAIRQRTPKMQLLPYGSDTFCGRASRMRSSPLSLSLSRNRQKEAADGLVLTGACPDVQWNTSAYMNETRQPGRIVWACYDFWLLMRYSSNHRLLGAVEALESERAVYLGPFESNETNRVRKRERERE